MGDTGRARKGESLVVEAGAPSNRPRIRGLDGIRAFAVLAVLGSHTAGTGLPGGFYGVDAFFALSGFLITSLLVEEFQGRAGISLLGFWARRARRLLPALFVLLTAIGIVVAVWPSLFGAPQLRGDALSTVFYVANWHLIAAHSNYFASTGPPSPLEHTWSLAIEEQFYLLWPLVVLAVLGIGRRSRRRAGAVTDRVRMRRRLGALLAFAVVGAVASAVWMAVLVSPFDTVRAYYGSDTRAESLLVGAALALAFALWGSPRSRGARGVVSLAGLVAVGGTVALWMLVPDSAFLAFHGGFLLAAGATCAVIASVVALPRGPLAVGLGLRPIRYLGRISYGMYLWYLPVTLAMSPRRTHLTGYELFAARFAVITALAALSAALIENPIRRGAIASWKLRLAAPAAAGVSVLTIFAATVVPAEAGTARVAAVVPHVTPAPPSPAPPMKVLLVGDSMAGSLDVGLNAVAPQYDAVVADEGIPGCSLAIDKKSAALTFAGPPDPPCQASNPEALFDGKYWVAAWNPDVVIYLARGETLNTQIGTSSSWQHIGQPAFDARLSARMTEGLQVLGSRGAHVFFLGPPLYDSSVLLSEGGEQGSGLGSQGSPFQEDDPGRVARDDALMQAAVAVDPAGSFLDLGQWLTPGARYTSTVNGVTARCADGVHLTPAGGALVAAQLFPIITTLAREHQQQAPDGAWPNPPLPGPPAWYSNLHC
ncbi:MAG TPA: acyltransferase family protein [Acidimicrobiales bacterium]|nr:acyltransferase family protein [Acidimicrobiales bacterium]